MEHLDLRLDLDAAPWHDLAALRPEHGMVTRVGLLPRATAHGRPALQQVIQLDSGRLVVAETTWALWRTAMVGLNACRIAQIDLREHP